VAIGPLDQHIHQFRWNNVLVPDDISLAGQIEIHRNGGRVYRKKIDDFVARVLCVPVARIFSEPDLVVNAPILQQVRPADRQWTLHDPAIAAGVNGFTRYDR